jgi:hypothetical protein
MLFANYGLRELERLPTLAVSQADDLKIDLPGRFRVWLSRRGIEDGEPYPNKVTIEQWRDDRWIVARTYEAKEVPPY